MAKIKGQTFIEEGHRVVKGQSAIDVAVDLAESIRLLEQYEDYDVSARVIVAPPDAIEDRYRTLKGELFVPVYAPFIDDSYNDFTALLTRKIREVERADVAITGVIFRIAQKGSIRVVSDGWTEPRTRPIRKGGKRKK